MRNSYSRAAGEGTDGASCEEGMDRNSCEDHETGHRLCPGEGARRRARCDKAAPVRGAGVVGKAVGGAGDGGEGVDRGNEVGVNVYCERFPCLNKRIHELHMELLQGVEGVEFEIDRHVSACAVLRDWVEEGGGDERGVGSGAGGTVALRVSCLCGDPAHDVVVRCLLYTSPSPRD